LSKPIMPSLAFKGELHEGLSSRIKLAG
jgi:hypothetical protein